MMRRALILLGVPAMFVCRFAGLAHGDLLLNSGGSGAFAGVASNQQLELGYEFTVGPQNLSVTDLGVLDLHSIAAGTGLVADHPVSLWDSSGTLLATATVPAGASATLVHGFRFVGLSSAVQLQAGQSYVLGAYYDIPNASANNNDNLLYNNAAQMQPIISTGLSYAGGRSGTGPGFPTDASDAYVGPNLEFNLPVSVPEPSTAVAAFLAASIIVGYRRLRRVDF